MNALMPVQQYLTVQATTPEAAIADFQVKRLHYEMARPSRQPAPELAPEPADRPLTMPEVARNLSLGLLAVVGMLAFGMLLSEPVARVLVWAGVLS